jgi:chemotaxis protein methyltransferase CheR
MKPEITDIEYANVCQAITARTGLNFSASNKTNFSRILAKAAKELGYEDLNAMVQCVISPSTGNDQFESLVPYLTNSETYFWREPMVFAALIENILPELIDSRKDKGKKINIWCAGCSTGEEAYSIAIALYRTLPEIKDWHITILASDIDKKSLSIARKGVYGSWSFRNSPMWLRNRYMNRLGDSEWEVIPDIKEMVTFSAFNLIQDNYLSAVCRNLEIDIIFCRNVLMYFTNEWASKISRKLFDSLSDKGWLIVSSCELSTEMFPQVTPKNFPGTVLYHKCQKNLTDSTIFIDESVNQNFLNVLQPPDPVIKVKKQEVSTVFNPVTPESRPKAIKREEIVDRKKTSIRKLADDGHLEKALTACNEAIASDKLFPGLYYIRASILQEMDDIPEAIKSLKQAIYIDPNYIMGHFTLGNLYSRKGVIRSSRQFFSNALDLLNTISDNTIPAESEGLSATYLKKIILSSLKTH